MANKKITELPSADALTGSELVELVQGGVNKQSTTQDIADLGGGGGGAVDSVNGQTGVVVLDAGDVGADPAGTAAALLTTTITDGDTTHAPDGNSVFDALALKVDEEDFATLTFATPVVWATNSRQSPLAKLTATGDFTIDMTNVKSGSQGVLKVTASTASAFTITFDTSFTNVDASNNASLLTYTFPALNGAVYFLYYVADGTTLAWVVLDTVANSPDPFAHITRAAAVSVNNNDLTAAVSFDTEVLDSAAIWAAGTPTRLVIPGSGNKLAMLYVRLQWASVAGATFRRIWIYVNGVAQEFAQEISTASLLVVHTASFQVACVGGDYIEIIPYQLSGGALSLDAAAVKISIKNRP